MTDIFEDDTPDLDGGDNSKAIAVADLRALIERVEKLEDERALLAEDVKEVKLEAKGKGFDMKAFNEMLKLRKMDRDKLKEQEALRELYAELLGVFG